MPKANTGGNIDGIQIYKTNTLEQSSSIDETPKPARDQFERYAEAKASQKHKIAEKQAA